MEGHFCNVLDPYSDPKDNPKHNKYDINSEYVFETNLKSEQEEEYPPIDEWIHKWSPNNGIVSWAVINTSDDPSIQHWEKMAVAIAFRTWQLRIKDVKFRRKRKGNLEDADIVIKFDSPETNNYFKDRPSVLAYAYFPGQGKISGNVTFNDKYIWSRDGKPINANLIDPTNYPDPDTKVKFKTYNIIQTLIHELGHSLGLKHNTQCQDCIMFPYYNGYVTLHQNDIDRIQKFYGKRILSQWILEYFRKRLIRKFNGKRTMSGIK